ncbi:GNAT family N-acetyltransferase [Pleurocapsales cyanobacterium LEGE 06147]|nr:GNAT family N-acetyltransferase [Pleurocapsales cyanobacterium LEGE 06147]
MQVVSLHQKNEIEAVLRRNSFLHLYSLGDLDDFFWSYTIWYALKEEERIKTIVLLYIGTGMPTLIALTERPSDAMQILLQSVARLLPSQFYAHLNREFLLTLTTNYHIRSHGLHYKMALRETSSIAAIATSDVLPLSITDGEELKQLYAESYPENFFDKRMLATGYYYGMRLDGKLVSVAGIHVYSPRYRVAVLGNITTHPQFRGRGLAKTVTAKVCQALIPTVEHIGLNVKADNYNAIACYEKLGFERIATYCESTLSLKANTVRPRVS